MLHALVLPAELTAAHRIVEFTGDADLLPLLHRETGADLVDAATVIPGQLTMWVGDDSLFDDTLEHNDRAIALCRHLGYQIPDVRGAVVFTGGPDAAAYTRGIGADLLAWLDTALAAVTAAVFGQGG